MPYPIGCRDNQQGLRSNFKQRSSF